MDRTDFNRGGIFFNRFEHKAEELKALLSLWYGILERMGLFIFLNTAPVYLPLHNRISTLYVQKQ